MRIVTVSVELTETQYMAIKRRTARLSSRFWKGWTTEEEIEMTAQAAVIMIANEEIKLEDRAVRNAQITDDFITDDTPIQIVPAHAPITDEQNNMPRQQGFAGKEAGDAEYEHLRDTLNAEATGGGSSDSDNNIHEKDNGTADSIHAGQDFITQDPATGSGHSEEMDLFLRCVQAEAGNQQLECKTATAEVITNRVKDPRFPDTITGVIMQPGQFSVVSNGSINSVTPDMDTITAVEAAINGSMTIPQDYIFFDIAPIGKDVIKIGAHYFGR